ncbi:MAG: YiiX family permuted papain-like enzyme [bacterium]
MTRNKLFLIFGLTAICCLGFYKFYFSPGRVQQRQVEFWNKRIKEFSNDIQNGDIIFQTSLSGQSKAIQLATHSEYSHCGLIYKNGNDYFVFEAVQPVKKTPLDKWIARGEGGHFVIKRLKNADQVLTTGILNKMNQAGNNFNGKDYDIYFDWSDEKIYCSELIWKIYQRATGLEIGKLEKLRDFDLTSEAVKQKMKERYGDKPPLDEIVISPVSIFNSDLLTTVKTN